MEATARVLRVASHSSLWYPHPARPLPRLPGSPTEGWQNVLQAGNMIFLLRAHTSWWEEERITADLIDGDIGGRAAVDVTPLRDALQLQLMQDRPARGAASVAHGHFIFHLSTQSGDKVAGALRLPAHIAPQNELGTSSTVDSVVAFARRWPPLMPSRACARRARSLAGVSHALGKAHAVDFRAPHVHCIGQRGELYPSLCTRRCAFAREGHCSGTAAACPCHRRAPGPHRRSLHPRWSRRHRLQRREWRGCSCSLPRLGYRRQHCFCGTGALQDVFKRSSSTSSTTSTGTERNRLEA